MPKRVIIVGAGGIGRACGLMLLEHLGEDILLGIADVSPAQSHSAVEWINAGLGRPANIEIISLENQVIGEWNPVGDIILDCTPGRFAPEFARVALRQNMHYANLTEHIPATREIYEIARKATTGFALQSGLAPGFINLLALKLVSEYSQTYPGIQVDHILMRVGSLSQYTSSPAHYAFVWSPMGVSTEYLNDCEVVDQGQKITKSSLSEREQITINGIPYEADLTSGGAADLPTFFNGKVQQLNYKTLRYPGHFEYIQKLKNELGDDLNQKTLLQRMLQDIPFHNSDKVLIYCSVSGKDHQQKRFEKIRFGEILPIQMNDVRLMAIQRTTASSLAQTAILLLSNRFRGILTQSKYPVDEFLNGIFIQKHYGEIFSRKV